MKKMKIANAGIALMAVMILAMFTACPTDDNGGGGPTKSDAKALTTLTVAGTAPEGGIPLAITAAEWADSSFYATGGANGNGKLGTVYLDDDDLSNAAVVANASSLATIAYAKTDDITDRSTIASFSAVAPSSFDEFDYLIVQVTAENGSVNYYAIQIRKQNSNANLSTLTVADIHASVGTGAATWDDVALVAGTVSLTNAVKDSAAVVATTSATTATVKLKKVAGTSAPDFTAPDTSPLSFVDGDFLYIEVTAGDTTTKLVYKVEVWIGRNADLANDGVVFGDQIVSSIGTGAATLAAASRGYIVFTKVQPAGGFEVTITAEDGEATIKYTTGGSSITETNITTAYTVPTNIAVNDTEFLYIEVTSANTLIKKYYYIEVGHKQTAIILAGSPEIRDSAEKYIDPLWGDVTEVYQIAKIAPFGDTTDEYKTQGTSHQRYTSGVAKAMWDLDGMYIYVDVTDAEVTSNLQAVTDSTAHMYDSFELFINEKADTLTSTPGTQAEFVQYSGQYRVGADGYLSGHGPNALAAFKAFNKASAWKKDDNSGYVIIMQAPWLHKTEAGLAPVDGKEIGFELQINACTGDGERDGVMVWNNIAHSNYQTNSAYGAAVLSGTPKTNAQRPQITAQPVGTFLLTGQAASLSVAASVSDGGTLSYQWHKATENGGAGTPVGTDSDTYTLDTSTAGVNFYYVVVTNTNTDPSIDGATTVSITSSYARIEVGTYTGPEAGEWAERITARGRTAPIYGFDLGASKLGEFTKVTFSLKVDPDSPNKSGLVARVYAPIDVITPNAGNIGLGNTSADGIDLAKQLIGNNTNQDIGTGYDDWATFTAPLGILVGLTDPDCAMKQVTGLQGFAIGFFVNDADKKIVSYYIKDIVLSNDDGTKKVDALYPGHPLLWAGAGANKCGTIYGEALEARELIGDTIVLAKPLGTLLTDRFTATPTFQTYDYQGKTWWVMATTQTGNTGDPVAPFDAETGDDADAFTAIKTIAAAYSRVSIDLSTITTDWGDYSKVTITYDLIQVGGTNSNVIFRNGTGGGSDPTVNATSGGYATTLQAGNGRTVTLPIGEAGENIKPSVGPSLAVVKENSTANCILLRISKIELGD